MEKKDYICGDKNHYVRYSHSPLELPNGEIVLFKIRERRDRYLFQIEYEQLDNKEVKECLGKLENHQELVYIT